MDRERMERFVRDVRFAKAKEFCKNGHHYIENKCVNCGTHYTPTNVGD